jgi:hypothetical protein
MSHCTACGDTGASKLSALDAMRDKAKTAAVEKAQPQAICKEEIDGTLFVLPAAEAIQRQLLIVDIVSGR